MVKCETQKTDHRPVNSQTVRTCKMEERSCITVEAIKPQQNDKAIERKFRCFVCAVLVLFALLAAISVAAIVMSVQGKNEQVTIKYNYVVPSPQSHAAADKSYMDDAEAQQEHIEVVGDGNRFLILGRGSRLRHWKESTRTGRVKLKHHSFIVIQVPGLYRVYGQYAVFQPSEPNSSTRTVSVMLMRNRQELSMSLVEHCRKLCTRSFSKTIQLKKWDKLSLQSGTGGIFMVNSKSSYFGINLLQASIETQVKI